MNFGIETYEGLTEKDFEFPKQKQLVLPNQRASNSKIYIGLDKWGRTEWVGTLYPPRTKEKDYLEHYVKHFNSIELNATHYKIYSEASIKKWIEKVGDREFKFCPKMYQGVTHRGNLKGKDFILNEFFREIKYFDDFLGPIFVQVSETFSPKRKDELFEFLKELPKESTYFLEVRNEAWFSSKEQLEELSKYLQELNIGFVITDTPNRRDVVHMRLTIPKAFIRFGCFGDQELDLYRIEQWKFKLNEWFENGLEECYFFLHVHYSKTTPDFAKYVKSQLKID